MMPLIRIQKDLIMPDVLSEFQNIGFDYSGIIEGGKEETAINFKLVEKISAVCDLVI